MIWCADFETTNYEEDCRVWCWKAISIDERHEKQGLDIESFHTWLESLTSGDVIYFHNLKFDGEFIVYHLLSTGHPLIIGKQKMKSGAFRAVISDMGQWYTIEYMTRKKQRIVIKDSLKIWNNTIRELAESLHMDISKGEIDYNLYRPKGYEPTPEEWDYIDRDVRIAVRAMKIVLDEGHTKLTAGANALADYKMIVGKNWDYYFPVLDDDIDSFCRKSYRGGWCYANPLYKGKVVSDGMVLDVNSLYPSRMYYEMLPYGIPYYYEGPYKEDPVFPLYIQRMIVDFKLKPGHFPTVQEKHCMRFATTEYIYDTAGDPLELTMTSVDFELFKEHYDIIAIEYLDGYKFKTCNTMFREYIDKWMSVKERATIEKDPCMRALAKLFLNSLYGKFAKRPVGKSKFPYIGDDNCLHLELGEEEDRGSLYLPVGTFITAYARRYTIQSAQACKERFLYSDTDSLHLLGNEAPEGIQIDNVKLGYWKMENHFHTAKFIGAKCYAENLYVSRETLEDYLEKNPGCDHHIDWKNSTLLSVTCAGMPNKAKIDLHFNIFEVGFVTNNKLLPKHVPGGIVLKNSPFQIKAR